MKNAQIIAILRPVGSISAFNFFYSATATPQRFCSRKPLSPLHYARSPVRKWRRSWAADSSSALHTFSHSLIGALFSWRARLYIVKLNPCVSRINKSNQKLYSHGHRRQYILGKYSILRPWNAFVNAMSLQGMLIPTSLATPPGQMRMIRDIARAGQRPARPLPRDVGLADIGRWADADRGRPPHSVNRRQTDFLVNCNW